MRRSFSLIVHTGRRNTVSLNGVRSLRQSGYSIGTSATTFSPDLTCTREQIITMLYRTMEP